MNKIRWKTLGGRCIHQTSNGVLVYQNILYRWLTLNSNAIQTMINRHHPERPALDYIKALTLAVELTPGSCCLLGLGGAGVVHALSPFLPISSLEAVELNAEIIKIAKKYFFSPRMANLNIINDEASQFITTCGTHYRHVLVDLFDSHKFPDLCLNKQFFTHCYERLLPDGILSINLANYNERWPVFQYLRSIFKQSIITIPIQGSANAVILASKTQSMSVLLKLLQSRKRLKSIAWDTHWGYVGEMHS